MKFLCEKLILDDDNLKNQIFKELDERESNKNQLAPKLSIDENNLEILKKKKNEALQQKNSKDINGKMIILLNDIFAFKNEGEFRRGEDEDENFTDEGEEEKEEEGEEEAKEEEEKEDENENNQNEQEAKKKAEEAEKNEEEINQNKNDLKTRYGKEINEIEF